MHDYQRETVCLIEITDGAVNSYYYNSYIILFGSVHIYVSNVNMSCKLYVMWLSLLMLKYQSVCLHIMCSLNRIYDIPLLSYE